MNNPIGTGSALVLAGIFILLNFFGWENISTLKGASFVMMFYGLITIVASFQKIKRSTLIFAAVILSCGIILYVLDNYEILNWFNLILPSILFIVSIALLLLYFDNLKEYVFLFSAVFFFLLSILSVLFFDFGIVQLAHRITLILFNYWPLFFVLFGIMLLVSKPRKKLTSARSGSINSFNTSE